MTTTEQTVLAELQAREPIFHRPDFGMTRSDFERMTADDFCEVGAPMDKMRGSFASLEDDDKK
jgi:hypothetical protein